MSELIAGTHHKVLKSVVGIQVGIEKGSGFGSPFVRRASPKGRGGVFVDVFDLKNFVKEFKRTAVDKS